MAPGARAACDALLFLVASVMYCFNGEGVSASGFFFLPSTPAEAEIASSRTIRRRVFIAPSPASRVLQPPRWPVLWPRFEREIPCRCSDSVVKSHRPAVQKPRPGLPTPVGPLPIPLLLAPFLLFPPEMPPPDPTATPEIRRARGAATCGRLPHPSSGRYRSAAGNRHTFRAA